LSNHSFQSVDSQERIQACYTGTDRNTGRQPRSKYRLAGAGLCVLHTGRCV